MADKKISDFTAASVIAADDLLEIETAAGNSRKVRGDKTGVASVTSMPGSPATGDRVWRSDLAKDFYYDGTRWLTTQEFSLDGGIGVTSASATGAVMYLPVPYRGTHSIYITRVESVCRISTTGNWTLTVDTRVADNTSTTIHTQTISTVTTWEDDSTDVNALCDTAARAIAGIATENSGSASFLGGFTLFYRLVGT